MIAVDAGRLCLVLQVSQEDTPIELLSVR